ncbi:hypothetical protein CAL14_05370 [Bordetella genomosp. 9]|nr:hypothetical protein CAL14_05370 [Bordetella genomosp. 9]
MSGEPIWDEPTVRKALADVRCKTLEDAAEIAESQNHGMDSDYDQAWSASAVQIANRIRALIDKEPT